MKKVKNNSNQKWTNLHKYLITNRSMLLSLLLIISIGAMLRFYKLADMSQFEFDQEYAANFAYTVIKDYPIQLIGQGLSVQGLFMGPLYFYYLVPFYALFNLHPIGGAVGSVILGLFTILIYFWVGKNLFGVKTGLTLAFLRAALLSYLGVDWLVTPAFSSDLTVLLTWFCFYKYWYGQTKYIIPIFFLFGLYTSFHPILFPFYFVFLMIIIIKRIFPKIKEFLIALVAGIIPLLPLIKFEIDHSFLEVKLLFKFSSEHIVRETKDLNSLFNFLKVEVTGPLSILLSDYGSSWLIPTSIIILIIMVFIALLRIAFWTKSFHLIMLITTFVIFTLYYFLLPTHVPEYYFMPVTTLLFIYIVATANLLLNLKYKFLFYLAYIFIFIWNFNYLKSSWSSTSLKNLSQKDTIVREIISRQPENSQFFVSYIMPFGANTGYAYLFKVYNRVPAKDVIQPLYNIVYPSSIVVDDIDFHSGSIGLLYPN